MNLKVSMLKRVWRSLKHSVISVTGDPDRRRSHRDLVRSLPPLRYGLSEFGASAELEEGTAPVFAFSPTWRSGSTLLQRLVMSTDEIWMWGETYTQAEPLQQMLGMFRPFRDGFPDPDLFEGDEEGARDLTGDWIARLSPSPGYLMEAHRKFWDRFCVRPAADRGYERWGLKAVNLPIDYPIYLKRLYPDACLVFLVRNPYRSWLSYRRFQNWYASFPDDPVFTVQRFGRMWREHTEQFLRYSRDHESLLIRFEDLVRGGEDTLDALSEHIGGRVDPAVLNHRVSGTKGQSARHTTFIERMLLKRRVGSVARELDYEAV